MTGDPAPPGPDKPAPPPAPEGAGLPPNPDPDAEAAKREVERQVYARRTAADREAEAQQARPTSSIGRV